MDIISSVISICVLALTLVDAENPRRNLTSPCPVANISVQNNIDEEKFLGTWFEIRWYPRVEYPLSYMYIDYSHRYYRDPAHNNTLFYEFISRENKDSECKRRIRNYTNTDSPGKYTFYDDFKKQTAYLSYPHIEYDKYFVEFRCFNITSGSCENPDVSFWSRERSMTAAQKAQAEEVTTRLCVDQNYHGDTPHLIDCIKREIGSAVSVMMSLTLAAACISSHIML